VTRLYLRQPKHVRVKQGSFVQDQKCFSAEVQYLRRAPIKIKIKIKILLREAYYNDR
jgi:hypothetical protein